jgi:putative ABC transport system permease protein
MATPTSRSRSTRAFRALLRVLPFDFRLEHGREMEQVFQAQQQEAHHEGTVRAVARLWLEAVNDVLTTAPRQHVAMLRQDVVYAMRTLRRAPGFAAAAILTLAIGISASASIFTIINAFLFRPLPVHRPEQLVSIATLDGRHIEMPHGVSFRDLQDYGELTDVFSGLLGLQPQGAWLHTDGRIDRVVLEFVTENAFSLLGVRPALGRVLVPSDSGASVLVLAHDYWRSQFDGDPAIVGRSVRLNGQVFTVVGVAAERFAGLESLLKISGFVPMSVLGRIADDIPAGSSWLEARDRHALTVIGRLRDGVGIERARAALAVKVNVLAEQYPTTNRGVSLLVVPEVQARPVPQNGPMFHVAAGVLSGLAGLLLLITSANVANMLLARAASRGREMALRTALGARRGRIIRQLLTESLVLAMIGSAGAVLLAIAAAAAMEYGIESLSFGVPLRVDFSLDWRVLGVTLGVAVLAGLIAGLAPTWYVRRGDVHSLLKTGGRTHEGTGRGQLRGVLVIGQVAVSLVLLIVGGLFVKTLERARSADLGFRADHILLATVDLPGTTYAADRRAPYYREARERVAALPGVHQTAWISGPPFSFEQDLVAFRLEGQPAGVDGRERSTFSVRVTPEYFSAARVAIVAGRPFDARDTSDARSVAVINETLARQAWPGEDPLGKRLRIAQDAGPVEVVGVARDGKYVLLWEAPRAMLFQPLAQQAPASATLEIVTAGAPEDMANAVRAALRTIDPDVPAYAVQSMADRLEHGNAFLLFRVGALLTGIFGALGLVLASIGLYGVVAYDVTQRTHEIGVRMALGALRADILREVLSRGAWFAASGTILGLAIAAGLAQLLRTMLLGVSPFDPLTYGGTALLLLAVCLLASFVPARRASTVSPMDALRAD